MMKHNVNKMTFGGVLEGLNAALPLVTELAIAAPARRKARRDLELKQNRQAKEDQTNRIANFPVQGFSYYANGGMLPVTQTGQETPISDEGTMINGATHNQVNPMTGNTGVPVDANKDGIPESEVEAGEVVYKDFVFSKRLGYADRAEAILKEISKIEKKADSSKDRFAKNTNNRKLEIQENKLAVLASEQEAEKVQAADSLPNPSGSGEQFAYGGKLTNMALGGFTGGSDDDYWKMRENDDAITEAELKAQRGISYMKNNQKATKKATKKDPNEKPKFVLPNINGDDVVKGLNLASGVIGAINLARTPDIPNPIKTTSPNLDTDYNVRNQVQAVRGTTRNVASAAKDYGSANVATGVNLARAAQEDQALSSIYGEKENIETGLNNQQAMIDYQNQTANVGRENQFMKDQYSRAIGLQEGFQNIMNQTIDNFSMMNRESNLKDLDQQKINLLMNNADQSGVSINFLNDPTVKNVFDNDPAAVKALAAKLKANNRTKDLEKLKEMYPTVVN